MVWLIIRLITLKRPVVFCWTIILIVIFAVVCVQFQAKINNASVDKQRPVTAELQVYPDQVKVNGDQYQFIGKNITTGQQVQVYGSLATRQAKQQLLELRQCSRWQIDGQIEPVSIATNVNQFDARQYAWSRHVYNQITIDHIQKVTLDSGNTIQSFINWCHQIRSALIHYFATMPAMLKIYCNSLIIGNSDADFSTVMAGVKQLGLIHLFCISGMHVVLFVDLLRKALIYCHFNKETINWLLIIVLPCYLIIGGGSASLIRATLMTELTLIGQIKVFRLQRLDIWSLSLLGGLLYQPLVLLTLGGQLSYLLSLMLQFLPRNGNQLINAILLNLVGLPSILNYIFEWHCLSLFASYLMIPFFSTIIFPTVIISSLAYHWLPVSGLVVNYGLEIFQVVIDWISRLPGMIHFGKPPICGTWILFLLTLFVFLMPQNKKRWLALLAGYCMIFVLIHFPLNGEVTFFDIGQGDSFLIREPFNRRVTMIDTGGQLQFPKPKWAQQVIATDKATKISVNYLKSRGISKIDTLNLSHQDTDHIGFSISILAHMKVDRITFPKGMEKQPNFKNKVLPLAIKQDTKLIPITDQSTVPQLPLQIIHPFKSGHGANEDSVVLGGEFAGTTFLFMGDLDRAGERAIMEKYPHLKVDVLKLGHHGSKTASDPSFVQQLNPKLAVISAGRMNRYGHPNQETMTTLKKQRVSAWSTQKFGMISYQYDLFNHSKWVTKLKGDELAWMLQPSNNN